MKSSIRNATEGVLPLTPLGLGGRVLLSGESCVVDDDPQIVNLKLGSLARGLHVTAADDSEASTPASVQSYTVRISGAFDAGGTVAPGTTGYTVTRTGVGQFRVSLSTPLPSTDSRLVRVACHAGQENGNANAVGSILDASTLIIGVTSDGGGAKDASAQFAVLDFT